MARTTLAACLVLLVLGGCRRSDGDGKRRKRGGPPPTVQIQAVDAEAAESATAADPGRFEVSRTGPTDGALVVSLAVGGTAGADFAEAPLGATITIPPGAASAAIDVTPTDDADVEGLETVEVTVAAGDGRYAVGSDATASVFITDDDTIVLDVTVGEADDLITAHLGDATFFLLDVRTPAEFDGGHLANAENVNVNGNDFVDRVLELPFSGTVLVYCHSGGRSAGARDILADLNFARVYNMLGGITAWEGAGYPVVTTE